MRLPAALRLREREPGQGTIPRDRWRFFFSLLLFPLLRLCKGMNGYWIMTGCTIFSKAPGHYLSFFLFFFGADVVLFCFLFFSAFITVFPTYHG